MKKVLLTGATGLIGKYSLKPLLDAGFEVFAVSSNEKASGNHINWIKADLLNFEEIENIFEEIKPEYLLHFAWDTTSGSYLESNLNFDWVQASLYILKQFKLNGGKRAVYAGTCFEYEFKGAPLNEEDKLNPISTYAKCKNFLNQMATLYCKKNNISFGWGRIFYIYGENEQEKRLIPQVISCLEQDKEFITSSGELIKDYIFAGDAAEAFVKFLDSNVDGCVNICTETAVTIKEIVTLVAAKLNKNHLVKFENNILNEPKIIVGDNTRLKTEVKFAPKYSLEQGLDRIIKGNTNE